MLTCYNDSTAEFGVPVLFENQIDDKNIIAEGQEATSFRDETSDIQKDSKSLENPVLMVCKETDEVESYILAHVYPTQASKFKPR